MDSATFSVSPLGQFQQSPLKSRSARLCPEGEDSTQQFIWKYYWRVAAVASGVNLVNPPGEWEPTIPGSKAWGLQFFGQSGAFAWAETHPGADPIPKGKWIVSLNIEVYYPKIVKPGNALHSWLFINLKRSGLSASVQELVRDDGTGNGVFTPWLPSDAVPHEGDDPADVNSTWKFNLTGIPASPLSPYVITAQLIVPEASYCKPIFDAEVYIFTDDEPEVITNWSGFNSTPPFLPGDFVSQANAYVPTKTNFPFLIYDRYDATISSNPSPPPNFLISAPVVPKAGVPPASSGPLDGQWNIPILSEVAGGALDISGDGQIPPDATHGPIADTGGGYPVIRVQFDCARIAPLHALFRAQRTGPAFNYQFTDISIGGPVSWQWTFSDGGSSTLQNPTHTFPGTGTFTATLLVTNSFGDTSTHTAIIFIPLTASFIFAPSTYPTVNFNASASQNPVTYDWNWGDGTAHGTTVNPTHAFTNPGIYTVILTIGDGHGHTDSTSHIIVVGPTLAASFSSAGVASPAHTVQFTDTSIGTIQSWAWTFRETFTINTTSTLQNPLHTFISGGVHLVTFTVQDVYGFISQVFVNVPVP